MNNHIAKLLGIKEKNITFSTNCIEDLNHCRIIHAQLTYSPNVCPNCQQNNIVKNGTRLSKIKLLDSGCKPNLLCLRKQRFLCRGCQRSFTAKTRLIEKHCNISNQVKNKIIQLATETLSEKHIAQETNVSVHTVRRIVDKAGVDLLSLPTTLPKTLCFDEFKSTKQAEGAMSFSFCDGKTHRLLGIVESRSLQSIKQYFYRINRRERLKVNYIVTDMYTPYFELVREVFPKAKIVIDPFHLVQALNRELNRYRVKVMNQVKSKDKPLYNKFKRYWKLLLMSREKLNYKTLKKYKLFKEWQCSGYIVDYLLEQDDVLKRTYEVVHDLVEALNERNTQAFFEVIKEAKERELFGGLKRVLKTFDKLQDKIKQTLLTKSLSNGPIEGIHNKIKLLKRTGYGYVNYYHFKHRIALVMLKKSDRHLIKTTLIENNKKAKQQSVA